MLFRFHLKQMDFARLPSWVDLAATYGVFELKFDALNSAYDCVRSSGDHPIHSKCTSRGMATPASALPR